MAGEIQIDSVTALTASGSNIVLNNVNTATNRTNLGLGSIATQAANSVSISGGNITGGTIGSNVVFPAGHVISFQEVTYNTQITLTSTSFTTLSDIMSITITPKSSSSHFYLSANIPYYTFSPDKMLTATFFKNNSDFLSLSSGLGSSGTGGASNVLSRTNLVISYLDESSIPSTPVPIKYSVAFKSNSTSTFQRLFDSGITGTFILMEIQG